MYWILQSFVLVEEINKRDLILDLYKVSDAEGQLKLYPVNALYKKEHFEESKTSFFPTDYK